MIAYTNKDLFNRLINDAEVAKTMLDMNLSAEINNRILAMIERKKYSVNAFADLSKDYQSSKTSNNSSSYATKPQEFDSKEIYKKDKMGNIIA